MNSCSKNGITEALENEGVRVRCLADCRFCACPGQPLYTGLRDRLFDAPGVWSLFKCGQCGLVWLNPQPEPADMGKLYEHYYTHGQAPSAGEPPPAAVSWHYKVRMSVLAMHYGYRAALPSPSWESVGKVGRLLPLLREAAGATVMYLPPAAGGRLLDIGCGSGGFLAHMRDHGWQVQGIEPDPDAARVARERLGLDVATGTLEGAALPAASVDAITLHHVVEHLPDPVALLRECGRVLRPGGTLVAVTPNVGSFGHRFFKSCWRGLEPPRHLHLFSLRGLQACADRAGLHTESLRTIDRLSREIYIFSQAIRHGVPHPHDGRRAGRGVAYQAWAFLALEVALRLLNGKGGEELVLIAKRPG